MKIRCIFLLLFVISKCSFGQLSNSDSLSIIEKTEQGLGFYEEGNFESAKNQLLELITTIKEAEKKYKNNEFLEEAKINAMDYVSAVLTAQGNILKAISYADTVLKYFEEKNDTFNVALSLNNIGYLYQSNNLIDDAFDNYQKALVVLLKLPKNQSSIYIGIIYNNMGLLYEKKDNYDDALKYHNKSLQIRKEINDKRGVSESLNNIGNTLRKMDRNEEALSHLMEALKLKEEIKDLRGITFTLNNISIIYYIKGEIKKSQEYALESEKYAKLTGDIEALAQIKKSLSKNFYELKNYKEAFLHLKDFIIYNDSLNNLNNRKALYKHQAQYEYKKQKVIDDAEHEKQLIVEKEAKAKQRVIIYATVGGLALVIVFLVFVFNRLQVTRKQKSVIEEQKIVVEKAHHELEEKNKEITDSITYAKRIQEAILPSRYTLTENLKNGFILYKPKDIVAGDFYWMESLSAVDSSQSTDNSKLILFAAADCTGHGVPGAMVSVVCSNALSKTVLEEQITIPGKILDRTKELVVERFSKNEEDVKDGMDISLCSLNRQTKELNWAGANNPLWIIRNEELKMKNEELAESNEQVSVVNSPYSILEIKPDKQPIGKTDQTKPFTTHQIQLVEGDTLYIFTDGYQDQFGGEKGKKFKAAQLKELLLTIQDKTMDEQKEILNQAFEKWKGNLEQVDDVCLIGVRV